MGYNSVVITVEQAEVFYKGMLGDTHGQAQMHCLALFLLGLDDPSLCSRALPATLATPGTLRSSGKGSQRVVVLSVLL